MKCLLLTRRSFGVGVWCSIGVSVTGALLAGLVAIPIYAARGYAMVPEVQAAGAVSIAKAVLFLLLTTLLSAGVAGTIRRSVGAVTTLLALMFIVPALLNVVLNLGKVNHQGLLVAIGNVARFFPVEGARYSYEPINEFPFAEFTDQGALQVSSGFGILVTAFWAVLAVIAWFITDIRRSVGVR